MFIKTLSALMLTTFAMSSGAAPGDLPPQSSKNPRIQWWREARFGMFVHWGPVSLIGNEISWTRGGIRRGYGIPGAGAVPVDVYDNLYKQFNPVKFDADEWVSLAEKAGMKYLVFTTKHHDGFCMFDSALTDYKITQTPFKRSVVKELADACHRRGMKLGFYYSQPDWRNPFFHTENHAWYQDYLYKQLRELCTYYGQVDIIWFDGLGAPAEEWNAPELLGMIRSLQPNIIINDRCGLPEDFTTPEQRIGTFDRNKAWESCITMARNWAYNEDDVQKSFEECIRILTLSAGGDGNLLLNVSPGPDGAIPKEQCERLREIGDWMDKYGESVYGTTGGPFKPGTWGCSTLKDKNVYLHIFGMPKNNKLALPAIAANVVETQVLTGGKVKVAQDDNGIVLSLDKAKEVSPEILILMELDRPAIEIEPVEIKE